ncbi:MAG TPA: flagellar export chaperone FliS [Deltaproteobacteria bacterium]|nr:flagellar export chaperone FliS [Deltaproteobacteria bacterium]
MGMNMAGYEAYKKTQVQTADQGSLILMCYDGAITFIKKAEKAHKDNDFAAYSTFLNKAQNIIWELHNSLNYEAGKIAHNLESIYNYMIRKIIDADYHKDIGPAQEVLTYLKDLRESWATITKKTF